MILDAIFNWGSIENPSSPLGSRWDLDGRQFESESGVTISREAALKLSGFWRGVTLRSDYIARLPLEVKRKTERGREVDALHPAYNLLMYQPNQEQNAFTLKKTAEAHQILSGNGYIYIMRLGSGAPAELWNLDPDNTWPVRVGGQLWYTTMIDYGDGQHEWRKLPPEDVIHLKGLGFNGLCGYPFMRYARETLGMGLAANEYSSRFFRNNAEPRVIISVPGIMPQEAQARFAEQWNMMHQGLENSHRTAVLTNGATIQPFSISARDAQLLDQRKFTLIEIANLLGLPPHKVGASDRIAYNSLEQENQAFSDDTLEPRMREWEQELRNKLLTEKQKATDSHTICFDRNELVRADVTARAAYLDKAIGKWMTIDEGRTSEGMNPLPGEAGDQLQLEAPSSDNPAEDPNAMLRDKMETYGVGVRAGVITPQMMDEEFFRKEAELPAVSEDVREAWEKDEGTRRPITITPPPGEEKPSPFGGGPPDDGNGDTGDGESGPAEPPKKDGGKELKPGKYPLSNPTKNHETLLLRTCNRLAKRIAAQATNKAKDQRQFMDFVDRKGVESLRSGIVDELEAVCGACADVGVSADVELLVAKIVDGAQSDLFAITTSVTAQGLVGAVEEWGSRFTGATMEGIVREVFTRGKAA